MSTAAFCATDGRAQADACLRQHVIEFERLGEIGVEHHGAVRDGEVFHRRDNSVELVRAFLEQRSGPKHRTMSLHRPLHRQPDRARAALTFCPSDPVEPCNGSVRGIVSNRRIALPPTQPFLDPKLTTTATTHYIT